MSGAPLERASNAPRTAASRRMLLIALPLIVVIGLFGLFFVALDGADPQRLPSALIGREVPDFELPPVPTETGAAAFPGFRSTELARGEPSLVNIFASWCAPCIIEHPLLMQLGQSVPIYGINYKDKPDAARRFIGRHGNPYRAIGRDDTGRTAIEFGVYGVPETFVIDGAGRIILRHAGPLTQDVVENQIKPALAGARANSPSS